MATTKKTEFSLETNMVARELNNLSNDELAERYFSRGSYSKDKFAEEMQTGINLEGDGTGPRFPLAKSIAGINLDTFYTEIFSTVSGYWISDGFKVNVEQIWEDFESILKENKRETASVAANREKLSPYIQKITRFFNYLLLTRAYSKEETNSFDL